MNIVPPLCFGMGGAKSIAMRTTKQIDKEIRDLKKERVNAFNKEVRDSAANASVSDKLEKEWGVIVTDSGPWWCSENGLEAKCTADEFDAMRRLEKDGFVEEKS